jgi:hypothetical protein
MKPTKTERKLRVKAEVLRALSERELASQQGGVQQEEGQEKRFNETTCTLDITTCGDFMGKR